MPVDNLQRMIARQDALRRARDRAWMLFAALLVAGLFLFAMAFERYQAETASGAAVALYAGLAVVATLSALGLLSAARQRSRRLDEALRPESAQPASSDAPDA